TTFIRGPFKSIDGDERIEFDSRSPTT
ncbi:unnamed protein product, partial [Rotaria socialis]